MVYDQHPPTRERRGRSCANADERHDTHREGKMYVMVRKLKEGVEYRTHFTAPSQRR
jgi:hypothetical protein